MATRDLYGELGVKRTAASDEIKEGLPQARPQVPSRRQPGNREAEERFKRVSFAHDVLSDADKRKAYDEFGEEGCRPASTPAGHASSSAPRSRWAGMGGWAAAAALLELRGHLRRHLRRRARRRAAPSRVRTSRRRSTIDLLDAIPRHDRDRAAHQADRVRGLPRDGRAGPGATCPECRGRGQIKMGGGPMSFGRRCERCQGSGRIPSQAVSRVSRARRRREAREAERQDPAGVDDGSRIRLAGKGGRDAAARRRATSTSSPRCGRIPRSSAAAGSLSAGAGDDRRSDARRGIDVPTPDGA
jgi:molecular chaperone DnaJ